MEPGSSRRAAAAEVNPVSSPHRRGGEEKLVEWKGREQPGQAHTSRHSTAWVEREREREDLDCNSFANWNGQRE